MTVGGLNWLVVALRYFFDARTGLIPIGPQVMPPAYDLINILAHGYTANSTLNAEDSLCRVNGTMCLANTAIGNDWAYLQVGVYFLVGTCTVVYVLFNVLTTYCCDIDVVRQ